MAVAATVALTVAGWMAWRHWEDGRWDNQAIAAQFKDFTVQRQNERDVHLLLRYRLTNATRTPYQLAPPQHGVLMRRVPEGDLEEIDSVVWEPIVIPAGKTADAEFDVTLPSAQDAAGTTPAPDDQDLKDFANHELAHMQGLVFFDYGKRYWIDLPKGWP
ncbi:MAG: hypothetical protein ACLGXA_20875 [Acidobacteriota bacterium]